MKIGKKKARLNIHILLMLFAFGQAVAYGQDHKTIATVTSAEALGDSLLRMYSLDELLEYQKFYEGERDRLEDERMRLREKGIQDLEAFIRSHPESRVLDKVIFRLAELYYEKSEDKYHDAQEKYGEALDLYDNGKLAEMPVEPRKDFSRSLALYQYILDNFPNSKLLDDCSYNLAFLTDELNKKEEAISLYEKFIENFPDSRYMPEVLMRQAEYYFNPPVNQIERAIEIYKKILAFTSSPRFDEALYRLGWSFYRLNDYPKAISYFTMLADDINNSKKYDPDNKITNPSLKDESVEYIGISFLDFNGVDGAAKYLKDIGGRDYGFDILKKMGDSYLEVKEEYEYAVKAYQTLLSMYPLSKDAPFIQAKVAEAYRLMKDDQDAYLMRKRLFANYHKGTTWWQNVSDPTTRERALKLAEHALRVNINLLLETANKTGNENLYAQAVDDSREYLQYFPEDSNAVLIHWNMALTLDTKLKMANAAFDEYIKISNDYWESKFQKIAAKNAIAIAQDYADTDTTSRSSILPLTIGEMREQSKQDSSKLRRSLELVPIPLTAGEQKLAQAIDNFIKLFPFDEDTPERLSQAGSMYYNKNHFIDALKYFKTLLKHFPDDSLAGYAEYLVMESYFGKLDYKSVEIVAKRLRDKFADSEYASKANQRLAEAIFLQAESLADSAQHFKAAEEYRRVADEVPNAEFADLALFNAGLEFDRGHEYSRAVETYSRLADKYATSEYYILALNNMALDYGELKDYLNAAITFERLAEEDPDSAKAETHLYNASVFFVKAEDWQRAIRVNKKFVNRYPKSEDADDLFYDIATYYLKLGDIDQANGIYGEYAQKFPDSPRVVETYYRRGEYFKQNDQMDLAKSEFENAIAKSDEFHSKGKDANEFFAAEALFELTELKFKEYKKITFKLPLAQMQQSKKRKKELLLQIVEDYSKVAAYGTIRLYESTFKIGLAYENFAKTWASQEIPNAQEEKRIVARKEINQTAADLYERALEAYKNSREVLTRIANQYRQSFVDTSQTPKMQAGKKVSFADSTLQVASRWIERSGEKISETIYNMAEINYSSVVQLLQAPLPAGLDKITSLEFRNQLIGKFIRPLIAEIVKAHSRNLKESDELNLENDWVDLSRKKIISTNDIVANEYAKLAWDALQGYEDRIAAYVKTLPEDAVIALNIADEMANYIDFSRAFAKATINGYKLTIDKALDEQINNFELQDTEKKLFEFTDQFAAKCDSLAKSSNQQRKAYEIKFRQTKDTKFEDGLFTFEDNFFSLSEANKEILGLGFELAQKYHINNLYTENITLSLVRSDPEQYANVLGLEIQDLKLVSDSSWLASTVFQKNWMDKDYDDSGWQHASIMDSSTTFPGYGASTIWLLKAAEASSSMDSVFSDTSINQPHFAADSLSKPGGHYSDSLQVASAESRNYPGGETLSHPRHVYFRKSIEVVGLPVMGQLQLLADDSYKLFVNGEFISEARLDSANQRPQIHDFSEFLEEGKNIVALDVTDINNSGGGLDALVFLKSLPGWDRRQAEIEALKRRERENLLFDKGILPRSN